MSDIALPGRATPEGVLPLSIAEGSSQAGSASIGLTFVEMAFAVALGDTATQVAEVMKVVGESPAPIHKDLWAVAPSLSHLALTIIVIATSWVGWYHSSATQKYMRDLKPVLAFNFPWLFAFPFIMLLVDVFLVVCYFVLSEGAEIPSYDANKGEFHLVPSAKSEVDWIMAVLATYLFWNVLFSLHAWWIDGKQLFGGTRVARIVAAIGSLLLAYLAFRNCRFVTKPEAVLMVDLALFAAVLMFRLRGVDDQGRLQWWDVVRGVTLTSVAVALIWGAAVLG
jgi:hypothetical protein